MRTVKYAGTGRNLDVAMPGDLVRWPFSSALYEVVSVHKDKVDLVSMPTGHPHEGCRRFGTPGEIVEKVEPVVHAIEACIVVENDELGINVTKNVTLTITDGEITAVELQD